MEITRSNYEVFFLDFYEGTLSPSEVDALYGFLELNHDLKEEFETFENIRLTPDDSIHLPGKQNLIKNRIISIRHINASNYDHFFVATVEGDISTGESELLQRFLQKNPHLQREFDIILSTLLKADTRIVFPEKQFLKKKAYPIPVKRLLFYSAALAAILIIIFMVVRPSLKHPDSQNRMSHLIVPGTPAVNDQLEDSSAAVVTHPMTSTVTELPVKNKRSAGITRNPITEKPDEDTHGETLHDRIMAPLTMMKGYYNITETGMAPSFKKDDLILTMKPRNTRPWIKHDIVIKEDEMTDLSDDGNPDDYPSVFVFVYTKLRKAFRKVPENKSKDEGFSFWSLADLGVVGINRLTDSNFKIDHANDESGKTISYSISNDNFEISRTKEKNPTDRQKMSE